MDEVYHCTVIDSHCHLAAAEFDGDRDAVIARAHAARVTRIVTIGDTIEESEKGLEIAEKNEHIFCTVGVHPHHAKAWTGASGSRLKSLVDRSRKVKAIGEIGLDYYYDFSPREMQRMVFREQLRLAGDWSLPVVIHCREAAKDIRSIVEQVRPKALVIHCCTEAWDDVAWCVDAGYCLSFTGIATFPKSTVIRETIAHCPLEHMMIETDAPYLAPVPHRGKRNEPAYVTEVARCIAEVKGISLQEIDEVTTNNAVEFFRL
jgi:TatD DNase family protein